MLGTVHHIGFVMCDITRAENHFASLGHVRRADPIEDDYQDAEIIFLERKERAAGEPLIELVKPRSERSRVYEYAVKSKFRIHHLCYVTENIEATAASLLEKRFFQVTPAMNAPAIGNSLISFFYSRETGLFEIVERPPFS